MSGDLTEQARALPGGESLPVAYELVYEFDAKIAAKAYKGLIWKRARKAILISASIALSCLLGLLLWQFNLFLVLGTAYPTAYIVMWYSQMGQVDEVYESLQGRKTRLLFDEGGISTYSGNTFKRVQWPGVARLAAIADYYLIYFERDSMPSGGFPKHAISPEALEFLRRKTVVND